MILNFNSLYTKYNLKVTGIFHAGAHYGEEYSVYKQHGILDVVFFEPVRASFSVLAKKMENEDSVFLVNSALGSSNTKGIINIDMENSGQSSSILEPDIHLLQYPGIHFTHKEEIDIKTLDSFIHEYPFVSTYNFLYMDVQGFELEILKGSSKTLDNIQYVMTEVNNKSLYKNCALVDELDAYLAPYKFKRVETNWIGVTWGDAFYIKTI